MLLFYLASLSSLLASRYPRVWFSAFRRLYSALNFLSSYMNSARSSSSLLRYYLSCCASKSASFLRCIRVFCLNSSFLSLICSNSGNCALTLASLELSISAMESRSCCTFFSICCGEPLSANSPFSSSYLLRYILRTSYRLLACRASTCQICFSSQAFYSQRSLHCCWVSLWPQPWKRTCSQTSGCDTCSQRMSSLAERMLFLRSSICSSSSSTSAKMRSSVYNNTPRLFRIWTREDIRRSSPACTCSSLATEPTPSAKLFPLVYGLYMPAWGERMVWLGLF